MAGRVGLLAAVALAGCYDLGALSDHYQALGVMPASTTIAPGASAQFSASRPAHWRVVEPGGGLVDDQGVYIAPAFVGTFHVVATLDEDPRRSATATVAVAFARVDVLAGVLGGCGYADGPRATARFGGIPAGGLVVDSGGLVGDGNGNLYLADAANRVLRKIDASGNVTTLAGRAGVGGSVDGAGADARFGTPYGLALDGAGTLFVSDPEAAVVRAVDLGNGAVTTLVGHAGQPGYADGRGAQARFNRPTGLAFDPVARLLYVADSGNAVVRAVSLDGETRLLVGKPGMAGGDDMQGLLGAPTGLALDGSALYLTDHGSLRRFTMGQLTTLAGQWGVLGGDDGIGGAARLGEPGLGLVVGADGLYLGDPSAEEVRLVALPGARVSPYAGLRNLAGFGDGPVQGGQVAFNRPSALAFAGATLYVNDGANCAVRRVVNDASRGRLVDTVAGAPLLPDGVDGPGSGRLLFAQAALASNDGGDTVYFADAAGGAVRAAAVIAHADGTYLAHVAVVAGQLGTSGNSDGAALGGARFDRPGCVASAPGILFVCDVGNAAIRALDLAHGTVSTVVTNVYAPSGVTRDENGVLYVTSASSDVVWQYDARTMSGPRARWGVIGIADGADGIDAAARFNGPAGIVYDGARHLLVADTENHAVRAVDVDSGQVTTYAGALGQRGDLDGARAAARFNGPLGLALDRGGGLLVSDADNGLVRRIDRVSGDVRTVLGTRGQEGVAVGAAPARLNRPFGLALLRNGELVVSAGSENVLVVAH